MCTYNPLRVWRNPVGRLEPGDARFERPKAAAAPRTRPWCGRTASQKAGAWRCRVGGGAASGRASHTDYGLSLSLYIYICIYMCIYIYIERERERESEIYIYIYIYI